MSGLQIIKCNSFCGREGVLMKVVIEKDIIKLFLRKFDLVILRLLGQTLTLLMQSLNCAVIDSFKASSFMSF